MNKGRNSSGSFYGNIVVGRNDERIGWVLSEVFEAVEGHEVGVVVVVGAAEVVVESGARDEDNVVAFE